MSSNKYNYSVENFRGIAILFVVLSHLQFYSRFENALLIKFIISNATAFFVFVAGFLLYVTEKNRFQPIDYFTKKLKYVVLPYLIVSIPYVAYGLITHKQEQLGISEAGYVFWSYLVGGTVAIQLWFIPMIVCIILLTPIIINIGRIKDVRVAWTVTLSLVLLSLFTSRPFLNLNPLLAAIHFLGFYVLGVTTAARYQQLLQYRLPIFLFSSLVFLVSLTLYASPEPQFFEDGIWTLNAQSLNKLALAFAILFGFAIFLNRKSAILKYFADISYGLFFVHTGVFFSLSLFASQLMAGMSPYEYMVFEIGMTLILSVLLIVIIRSLLGARSRYVIGC